MAQRFRVAAAGVVLTALASSALAMSPATAVDNKLIYVESVDNAVAEVTQILAAGDVVAGYTWVGVPDGMGGVKNADGTITVYVTHELSASDAFVAQTERSYGGFGAFISAVKYNPVTKTVVSIKDAIKSAAWYDYEEKKFGSLPVEPEDAPDMDAYSTPNHTTAINRFCSATLVKAGDLSYTETKRVKYFVKVNGKKVAKYKTVKTVFGTKDPIFVSGEEGESESRIFALNTKLGALAQLPAFGLGATENISIAPASKTKKSTVALIGEDGDVTDSQLFLYKGTKKAAGTWYQKAGLTDGMRYVAKVSNSGLGLANDVAVRTALTKQTITSAVRGVSPVATTKVKIVGGVLTVTTASAHSLKAGDVVTLAGFGAVGGVDLGAGDSNVNGTVTVDSAATTTTFTTGVDADDLVETAFTAGTVAIASDVVVVTTSAVHGFVEGDQVKFDGMTGGLSGRYTVSGAPTTTVFTVIADGAAFNVSTGKVNELLDVTFKKVSTDIAGDAQQVIAKLRGTVFSRVEDGNFNPANPNEFFFITTQSDSDGTGVTGVKDGSARDGGALWKVTFENVANPSLGAVIELVLDGTEAPLNDPNIKINKPDNLTITNNGLYALLQEDPGGNNHIARLMALRLSDKALVSVAEFDADLVHPDNVDTYLTNDEESSGVFDATSLLASAGDTASYFFFNAQFHPLGKDGGGNSLSTDPLKATVLGLMRPDLIAQTTYDITNVYRASGSATSITVTVEDLKDLAVNDLVTLRGATKEINGTYAVTAMNSDAKTFTVTVKSSVILNGNLTVGDGLTAGAVAVTINGDEALALKTSIIEGGALYTLKITNWDELFTVNG
jgi:hypothetical protein